MNISIDLNADLGEGDACDTRLLEIVSSCNIACGGHAGDANSMQVTVVAAMANGVATGAHPSYPDRQGFGRRSRFLYGEARLESLVGQVQSLHAVCDTLGTSMTHLKPHGALYGDAAGDAEIASIIVKVINELCDRVSLVGPPDCELETLAQQRGIQYVREAFIDRGYLGNGLLVPRSEAGAVHENLNVIESQAVSIAVEQRVRSLGGDVIPLAADTLCVHGDTPGAVAAASRVRQALQQRGVQIRAIKC